MLLFDTFSIIEIDKIYWIDKRKLYRWNIISFFKLSCTDKYTYTYIVFNIYAYILNEFNLNVLYFQWKRFSGLSVIALSSEIFYQSLFNIKTYKCPKNSICMCLVFTAEMVFMIIYQSRFIAISEKRESSEIFLQSLLINMMKKLIQSLFLCTNHKKTNLFHIVVKKNINSSLLMLYISI